MSYIQISDGGWVDFDLPTCVAPGQYLLRAEIIALHSASKLGQAQFYIGCAQVKSPVMKRLVSSTDLLSQINVTSFGTESGSTVSFPGAYSANNPGILINIYNSQGQPKGNGQPYKIPGPAKLTC